MDYEDRYGERYGPYDRDYERPLSRRPVVNPAASGGYVGYDNPYKRPYYGGGGAGSAVSSGSLTPLPNDLPIPGALPPPHPHAISPYGPGGPVGLPRPPLTRCEESDNFKQVAARHKMRRNFIRRSLVVPSLIQCERECVEARDFVCRSFNYRLVKGLRRKTRRSKQYILFLIFYDRDSVASNYDDRDVPNCELSDRDSRELDVHDPNLFDAANYDFYERSMGRSDGECMDGNITFMT